MTLENAIENAKTFLANTKHELEIALAHLRNIVERFEGAATPIPAEANPSPLEAPAKASTETEPSLTAVATEAPATPLADPAQAVS
jgi:hypothetical protein